MRFASDVSKKGAGKAFTKYGVNVFADESKTALRDPAQIIMESVHKTGGALPALGKMFGERSVKAVEPFRKMYVEAGGGSAGVKAMMTAFKEKRGQRMSQTEITESAAFRRAQEDKTFSIAMGDLTRKMGAELLPAITELIPAITKLAPLFISAAEAGAKFVGWLAENPYTGIAAIIGGLIAKDIAMAGIGMLLRAGIAKALLAAGITVPGAVVPGAAAAPGALASAGAALAKLGPAALASTAAAPIALAGGTVLGAKLASEILSRPDLEPKVLPGDHSGPTRTRAVDVHRGAISSEGVPVQATGVLGPGGGGAGGGAAQGGPELKDGALQLGVAAQALRVAAEHMKAIQGGMGPANTGSDPSQPRGPLSYRTGFE